MNDPFMDFKIVDGVKLFRGVCKECGCDFWHKSPYKLRCADKERDKEARRIALEKASWAFVGGTKPDRSNWSGGWDNAVRAIEEG